MLLLPYAVSFKCHAQAPKDSLIFYRQQMLLGELLSIETGRVSFDSDDAGVLSVKNYKIKTMSASMHLYRIRTSDHRMVFGSIHKSSKDGHVKVRLPDDSVEVRITNIIELQRFDTRFKERISGKLAVGYNFTKSSDIGRFNFDFNIRYLAPIYESTLKASSIVTQNEGTFSRDIESITSSNLFNLSYRWVGAVLLSYQRNLELGILRRFQEAVLFGYNITNFNNRQLTTGVGIALNQELTGDNTSSRTLVEIPFVISFRLYQFRNPNIELHVDEKAYFGVTETGRVRNDANITIDWEVINDFTLGINLYSNYDNLSPETSTSNFDYGVVLNVGYKF